jgi:hypothetical protein
LWFAFAGIDWRLSDELSDNDAAHTRTFADVTGHS